MADQQHNPAAVRVCAIADIQCSRGCGAGACKREREARYSDLQPAAAPMPRYTEAMGTAAQAYLERVVGRDPKLPIFWADLWAAMLGAAEANAAPSPADERAAQELLPIDRKWVTAKAVSLVAEYRNCKASETEEVMQRFVDYMQAALQDAAARAASANETEAEGAAHAPAGYGLTAEQLATLQSNGLKPEEIGGNASTQHDRVRELVHWFARFARGEANPKWAHAHAFELAYFIASNGQNRHIDLREIADKAYLEGVNISASDRSILERLGKIAPQPAPAAIPAGFALVPIEPTPEILTAIWQNERDSRRAWERAIATVQQPAQADARIDVEAMLRACVPGGDICDPQRIADSIREWFDEHGQNAAQAGARVGLTVEQRATIEAAAHVLFASELAPKLFAILAAHPGTGD